MGVEAQAHLRERLDEPKVGELDVPVLVDEQVVRLDVPMDHLPVMQERHSFEDLPRGRGGMTFREYEVLMPRS